MGFESVTEQIVTYLNDGIAAGQIPGLAKVFDFPPSITNEGDFTVATQDPQHKLGTVLYLFLQRPSRARVSVGGQNSGIKKVVYELTLICFTRSNNRNKQMVGRQAQAFIDAITAYIEANRTANSSHSSQPIFQWGEGDTLGAVDLEARPLLPRQTKMGVAQVFTTIQVKVLEFLYV